LRLAPLQRIAPLERLRSRGLHDANRNASMVEEATASAGGGNVLIVMGATAEEVAEFFVLSAEPVCRVMLLEAAHTSDPSFDPAMVLFQSIVQVHVRPLAGSGAKDAVRSAMLAC
jgi:hypothetical protein